MSEIATSTATVESTPTSTTEAAEQVMDAFEQTETTGSESGDTPASEPGSDPVPGVVEPPKTLSEVEQLLHAEGFKEERRQDGRENRIPYSKVKKIIENGLKKGRADFDTRYATVDTEAQTLRGQMDALRQSVSGDPKAFLSELATHDQRYRAFLEPQAQPAAQGPAPDAQMPQPDLKLQDGSSTYSLDGLQKLLEWNTARVEAKVEARLKPLAERDKADQTRREQAQQVETLQARTRDQMTEAQTWPMFGPLAADGTLSETQAAVLAELKKDSDAAKAAGKRPTLTLEGAYIRVTGPKLTGDRNKMREELLKELNTAPKGTSVPRNGGGTPNASGAQSTADIASRTLARLERSGGV